MCLSQGVLFLQPFLFPSAQLRRIVDTLNDSIYNLRKISPNSFFYVIKTQASGLHAPAASQLKVKSPRAIFLFFLSLQH